LKQARLRPQAQADLVRDVHYYEEQGGAELADRFFLAACAALPAIQQMPGMGSPHLGLLCDVPGLRTWPVKGFPVMWFYFDNDDHLDIVRLLGERQDLLSILTSDP
jgi:toxin ParE1/3/4